MLSSKEFFSLIGYFALKVDDENLSFKEILRDPCSIKGSEQMSQLQR